MLDIAAASAVISTLSSAMGLADKVYDTYHKFMHSGEVAAPDPHPHSEEIAASPSGDALVHQDNGHVVRTVTRDDLRTQLGALDAQVIEAIEQKMEILVARWSEITKEYELVDADQKAKYNVRLTQIAKELSASLSTIFAILDRLGFQLHDHYAALRHIAAAG